jgi:hypothetical protein
MHSSQQEQQQAWERLTVHIIAIESHVSEAILLLQKGATLACGAILVLCLLSINQ